MVTAAIKLRVLILVALVNFVFWIGCLHLTSWQKAEDYDVKMIAVEKAMQAQEAIGNRLEGIEYTPITTTLGSRDAKTLAMHPDFAGAIVDMLRKAGVKSGDRVAVNMSGSFPALNIAAIAAIDALGAKPIIISSVGASTWGANNPDFTWLDMEQVLIKAGVWQWQSKAVSIGGGSDIGIGLTPEGILLAQQAIERSSVSSLHSASLQDSIARRMQLFSDNNNGILPEVLVNVGGNHVVFGTAGHRSFFRQGLTMRWKPSLAINNGLAGEFSKRSHPIIHLLNIKRLAAEYQIQPETQPGMSRVFYSRHIPGALRFLIFLWIIGIFIALYYVGQKEKWWFDGTQRREK